MRLHARMRPDMAQRLPRRRAWICFELLTHVSGWKCGVMSNMPLAEEIISLLHTARHSPRACMAGAPSAPPDLSPCAAAQGCGNICSAQEPCCGVNKRCAEPDDDEPGKYMMITGQDRITGLLGQTGICIR